VGTNGPLSIAVDATSWQTYTGGILTNCISNQIDHGVLIVGFDLTNSPPYWIVKNSWGASWGENGYIRIEYGTDQCVITSYPSSSNSTSSGPTPAPGPTTPNGPYWTAFECTDYQCQNCEYTIIPNGVCQQGSNGFWYSSECASDAVVVSFYNAAGCTGTPAAVTSNPLEQCAIAVDFFGTKFVWNQCAAAPTVAPTTPVPTSTPQPYTPQPYTPYPTSTPVPPTPMPPTPVPTSPGNFTYAICQDGNCSVGCTNASYPQNICFPMSTGSGVPNCVPGALQLAQYTTSDCSGPAETVDLALDTCLPGVNTTTFFEVFCPSQTPSPQARV